MGLAVKTKKFLARTPLHRPLLELNSARRYRQVMRTPIRDVRTAYCISPYKTGASFIANMFDPSVSAHEPLYHLTLKHMHNPDFLQRRKAFLDLRVEAFGHFAIMAKEFSVLFPDVDLLFTIRDPSDWLGSCLDHAAVMQQRIHYHFGGKLFWRKVTRYASNDFYRLGDEAQCEYVTDMLNFWVRTYRTARTLPKAHIIRLHEVEEKIEWLEDLFNQKAVNLKHAHRNNSPGRKPFSAWDYVNKADFADAIGEFGY
jgi:hypothetical protein